MHTSITQLFVRGHFGTVGGRGADSWNIILKYDAKQHFTKFTADLLYWTAVIAFATKSGAFSCPH
jgi:hypothetical protein